MSLGNTFNMERERSRASLDIISLAFVEEQELIHEGVVDICHHMQYSKYTISTKKWVTIVLGLRFKGISNNSERFGMGFVESLKGPRGRREAMGIF
jgi:hypothetical protein